MLLAALVFNGLGISGRLDSRDDTFGEHGFRSWAAVATFSFAVWVALLGSGVAAARGLPESWRGGAASRGWRLVGLGT
ncbi:hypothetical protein [Streptomyces sp. NPDC002265]|uniref:hypothetical protein n=1 Tax=Streptomyces sp. NPDC002265 TaxID=3154415 RepID=UPI003332377A